MEESQVVFINGAGDETNAQPILVAGEAGDLFPPVTPKPFITGETLKWTYPSEAIRIIEHPARKVMNHRKREDGEIMRDWNGKAVYEEVTIPAYRQRVYPR